MRRYASISVVVVLLGVGWVYTSRVSSARPDPRLVAADNDFAFRIYREVAKKDASKNIFISPVSIALALQMTYNGATGTVGEGMAKALGVKGIPLDKLNQENANLLATFNSANRDVTLTVGNSIWSDESVKPEFRANMARFYEVEFGPLSVEAMNEWVSQKTRGKIKKMIEQLGPGDILVLMNAIYFKGDWETKFDKGATRNMPFQTGSGKEKMAPTMYQKSEFASMYDLGVSAIRLPYAKGRLSMYVFLPDSLAKFLANLNAKDWDRWMSKFGPEEDVDLYLPKFKLEYGKEMSLQLKAMGMVEAFEGEDFAAMFGGGGAWIGEVDHRAVIEVNEEGTEAAAATSVIMTAGGGPPTFRVDQPFFFAIRDEGTGLILFMGSVVDPTKN